MFNKVALIAIGLFAIQFSSCVAQKDASVALKVNGVKISAAQVSQVSEVLYQQYQRLQRNPSLVMNPEIRKSAARRLIANNLLLKEAEKIKIAADSNRVNEQYAQFTAQFPDKAKLQSQLTAMNETEQSIKKQIEQGIILDSLMKIMLAKNDSISEDECKKFYDSNPQFFMDQPQIRVSQMFFTVDSAADPKKRASINDKATTAQTEAKKGGNFDAIAKKYAAIPPGVKSTDMGWFKKGDLRPDLEQAVYTLPVNTVSEIVTSSAGFHLLKKTEEKSGTMRQFSEVKEQIKFNLDMKKRQDKVINIIDSLIGKASVVYIDTTLKPTPVSAATATPAAQK